MGSEEHYHSYVRMKPKNGRTDLYRCMHPDCRHYAPAELILGKYARCPLCFTRFIITKENLRLKTPHCGCRSLTPQQRENLRKFSETPEVNETLVLQMLQNTLKKGIVE